MQSQLTAALVQSPLVWEDAEANRTFFREKIDAITQPVDLIVLPEMFSTGFTMEPANVAETMNGKTVEWLKAIAAEKGCAITGSLVVKSGAKYYNRLIFVHPTREIQHYDKRHLFSLSGEDKAYTAGKKRLVVNYRGFKICPLICYDLRFPAFSRNTEYFDLMIYVANWPQPRIAAWNALLKARAIENMSYVIGVSRLGTDGNGLQYPGHSQVLDFMGEFVVSAGQNEGVFVATLEKKPLLEIRKKLSFLEDRDAITVK